MSRTPPSEVTRLLRTEVGFGCPVPGCGNPYLEWHHFDPPYAEEAHHRPDGMIALCAEHHKKADAGAYSPRQLRDFKLNRANAAAVRGSLDWMRNELLAVVGGNFYYETLNVVRLDGQDIVFFRRDEEGYLRVNVQLPSLSPEPRAKIADNFWGNIGEPTDLRSPPSGKLLDIRYPTGDSLAVEFLEISSAEVAHERYQSEALDQYCGIRFPITAVEINLTIAGTSISLTPRGTKLPGDNRIRSGLAARCRVGLSLQYGLPWRQNSSASIVPRFARNVPCPCGSKLRYKHCHGYMHVA
jgi:hypothetical protein